MRDRVGEGLKLLVRLAQLGIELLNHFEFARLLFIVKREALGLLLDDLRLARQFDEHRYLRLEHFSNHRQEHVIHRAESIAFEAVNVGGVIGGDKNDGRLFEPRPLPNQFRGFEAVHTGHVNVQQDDGEILLQKTFERLAPVSCFDNVLAQFKQNGFVGHQLSGLIVHKQNVDFIFLHLNRLGAEASPYLCSHTRMSESNWSVFTGLAM